MTPYEQKVLKAIRAWEAEEPGWGTRLLAKPGSKVAQMVQVVVPPAAVRAALLGADKLGRKLSDERSILKRAGVDTLADLRIGELEACDRLAKTVSRRATTLGGATGAIFGVAGAAGLVADIPTLLTLALRTVHRIGFCYGEQGGAEDERRTGIAIFALVSANSAEEKRRALAALRGGDAALDAAWRDGVERVAERELAKEATVYSLQNLARTIGVNLGRRKAAGAIPVLGAAVGGAVNAWYLSDVAQVARHVFQERWLAARYPGALR
ncbi:MAG TPA: EcsC family protein [Verrucomicrobiae bacterium]|nr:EcsC family protein [Verrucomicrobiae bacterium]